MNPLATFWNRLTDRATKLAPVARSLRTPGLEVLEARIAPATLAALPGNSNFEDTTDFLHWTDSDGPVSASFNEYLLANVSTTVVRDPLAPEGNAYAHLSFQGRLPNDATGFGPSLQSETFTATAGETISVQWRATNGVDTAHPRGRLFTAAGAPVQTFFDSNTGTTAWAPATVTVPSAGQYYLLFEAGSSDSDSGGVIGAALDIDAIHRIPNGITENTLMSGQLSVGVTGDVTSADQFLITLDATGLYVEIFVNGSLDFIHLLSEIDRIDVSGLGGSDLLTVDSSNGLIDLVQGIHFDGGEASDTLSLIQTGGSTHASDIYTVGPNAGEGTSVISDVGASQSVFFQNLEPVLDNVPATNFTVNGTAANNAISSIVGPGGGIFTGTTAKITVDSFASIEFNNKTALIINALGGSDTTSLNHPGTAVGLMSITVMGGTQSASPGDTLQYANGGSINPSAAGVGTITATGKPTVGFSGIEVAVAAGFTMAPEGSGVAVIAAGDQGFAGQNDVYSFTTDPNQFLRLALNGIIGLYGLQSSIIQLDASGLAGDDSLTVTGTSVTETFTFSPSAAATGVVGISGVPTVINYTATESVVLNALGGDDVFALNGALGRVRLIGGIGSDTVNFSTAAAGVVFDLDAVNIDQQLNATGEIVNLGDAIENFIGSSYNDTLHVNAATFMRTLNGGLNTHEVLPTGDSLFFDGQGKVVNTTRADPNTGTFKTIGLADVAFDEFETSVIDNSPSGLGFGIPATSNAFQNANVHNLLQSTSGGLVAPGKKPADVKSGDLNGDGFLDLVVANSGSANISVLLNLGDGTFTSPVSYKTRGSGPQSIAIGNFDAIPGVDIAVTNRTSSTLAILSGDNTGGFNAATLIKTASNPTAIAVGDFDGNAVDDLVIIHPTVSRVSVLLGNGAGFDPADVFKAVGVRPVGVVVGDFNDDGDDDVVTVNSGTSNIGFFAGDGLGGLAAPTLFATGKRPTAITVGDFNLDGVPDVAVSNKVGPASKPATRFVSVLLSNGFVVGPQFDPQLQVALPGTHAPTAIVAADFNGDGIADLGIANSHSPNFTVLLGEKIGKFSQPYEFGLGTFRGVAKSGGLVVGDFDHDGQLDIATTNRTTSDARVLLRNT